MERKLLTATELAREISVARDTVRLWARRGWIPEIRVSHKVRRFWLPDVLAALRARGAADGR